MVLLKEPAFEMYGQFPSPLTITKTIYHGLTEDLFTSFHLKVIVPYS